MVEEKRGVIPGALHPPGDYVSDFIRASGHFYEFAVLDELRRRLASGHPGTIIDVGAMLGNHTLFLAQLARHRSIEAFEPWPANRELLELNVAGYPKVHVHPFALAEQPGRRRMTAQSDNLGHAYLADDAEVEVEVRTLDSFAFKRVTLIKIDVEGWEPNVIAGARETIDRWRPLIALEDWTGGTYADSLPGYRLAAEWARMHQVYLYEPI